MLSSDRKLEASTPCRIMLSSPPKTPEVFEMLTKSHKSPMPLRTQCGCIISIKVRVHAYQPEIRQHTAIMCDSLQRTTLDLLAMTHVEAKACFPRNLEDATASEEGWADVRVA